MGVGAHVDFGENGALDLVFVGGGVELNVFGSDGEFDTSSAKVWGLSKNEGHSKQEKRDIPYASELCSKSFDFPIEIFSQ